MNTLTLKQIADNGVPWWSGLQEDLQELDENLLNCIVIDADFSKKLCERRRCKTLIFNIRETEKKLEEWGFDERLDSLKPFVRMKFGIDLVKLFKEIRKRKNR